MFKPAGGDAAITDFIICELFQYFHFGARMTQHVNKIIHNHIQVIVQEVVHIVNQFLTVVVVYDLGI